MASGLARLCVERDLLLLFSTFFLATLSPAGGSPLPSEAVAAGACKLTRSRGKNNNSLAYFSARRRGGGF